MTESWKKERQAGDNARVIARRVLRHENAVLVIILVGLMGAMSVVTNGLSAAPGNMKNILIQSSIRGTAAVGQTFVILTGGIDVSVAGMGLLCSYIGSSVMTANVWQNIAGRPLLIYAAIPIMLLLGTGIGAVNGSAVSRIGMPGLVVTLAMWRITYGAAYEVAHAYTIFNLPTGLDIIGSGSLAGVPVAAIIFIVIAVVTYWILTYTRYGRQVYAVGGNPVSAWLSGINEKRTKFSVYAVSGLMAAVAGVLSVSRMMGVGMQTLQGLELDTIAAVAIGGVSLAGGRGTMIGTVVGVFIISVINNAMSIVGATPEVQGIAKGAIMIAAVAIDMMRRR